MEKGAPYEGRFSRKRFTLPQLSSFARLCPTLFLSTGLAIAPLPAAAIGGFGFGGGGRPPGFMSHGGPGFAGRGFQGGSPWGTTLYRYKIKDKRSVPAVVAALRRDTRIGTVQPNYLYRLQGEQDGHFAGNQYAGPNMHVPEAHTISNGGNTLIAVIDSGIDSTQPEIAGTIAESYDAIDGGNGEKSMPGNAAAGFVHGTEVAGIIASRADLRGVAPQAHILAVRAFAKGGGRTAVAGTTYDILAGTEWAVKHKAQVINMSFAGPPDPDLARELAEGSRRRVIFIAAVGNEGKAAMPSYPAAYEDVIPVTATDRADAIFKDGSRCSTTCVAAPGVDVLVAVNEGIVVTGSSTTGASLNVTIVNSEASNNAEAGVEEFSNSATTAVMLRNVVASNNLVGLFIALTEGGNAILRVAHSVVTGNSTGVTKFGGGTILAMATTTSTETRTTIRAF